MQEIAAEKERIAKEKEAETARLRAMQERAADKQSELDELRARRYQEAKERDWRGKERAQAERQAAMQRELAEARAAQKNATLKQRAEMAKVEHEDFMRVLAVNRAKEHNDMMLVSTHDVSSGIMHPTKPNNLQDVFVYEIDSCLTLASPFSPPRLRPRSR